MIWFTFKKLTTRAKEGILPRVNGETFAEIPNHWKYSRMGNNAMKKTLIILVINQLENVQSIHINIQEKQQQQQQQQSNKAKTCI